MIEGGGSKNTETKSTDNAETKSSAPEKLYQELAKVATKLNDMLFSEDNGEKQNGNEEIYDSTEIKKRIVKMVLQPVPHIKQEEVESVEVFLN